MAALLESVHESEHDGGLGDGGLGTVPQTSSKSK